MVHSELQDIGRNADLRYSIETEETNNVVNMLFYLEPETGNILTTEPIDRELQDSFQYV